MNNKIKVRTVVRILSFTFSAFIVLGGFAVAGYNTANYYKENLEYTYERALDELSNHISNIEATLTKGMYANTKTQQHSLSAKLLSQSEVAKSSLSQLPLEGVDLSNINKFIAKVGDFSSYISQKISKGETLSREDIDNLKILSEYAKIINTDIQDITSRYSDRELSILETKNIIQNLSTNTQNQNVPFINTGFHDMNEGFTDFPTMIYDGPFSDHIMQMEPKLLNGKNEITKEDAIGKVCSFLGTDISKVTVTGENDGNLKTYNLSANNIDVSITKVGGYINSIVNPRLVSDPTIDFEQASYNAKEFLSNHNITNMSESYYVIANNICTINFAYKKDNITFYPDLIKVGVALDTGEIVSLNTAGYIMNHHERNLDLDIIDQKSAQNNISPLLNIESVNLSCIPTKSLNEVLCYEFNCESKDGQNIIVYINSKTGLEENILILQKYDNGILTI